MSPIPREDVELANDSFVTVTPSKTGQELEEDGFFSPGNFASAIDQAADEEAELRRSDEGASPQKKANGLVSNSEQAYKNLWGWFQKIGDGVLDLERDVQQLAGEKVTITSSTGMVLTV